jgi:hypothetical protein
VIVKNCYPTIIKTVEIEESIPIEEQAKLASEGIDIDSIPIKRKVKKTNEYLIDKVIVYSDILILKELETEKTFRYKLNKSSIFFLKRTRSNNWTKEEAGNYFFKHSTLLNEITLVTDNK